MTYNALLMFQDHKVLRVLLDQEERMVHLGLQVQVVHQAPQVNEVKPDPLDQLDLEENLAREVNLVLLDPPDHQDKGENLVPLALLVLLDPQVNLDLGVNQEHRAQEASQVRLEHPEVKVNVESQAVQDQVVPKDQVDLEESLVSVVRQDLKENKAHLEAQDHEVKVDLQVLLAQLVLVDLVASQDSKENLDSVESLERQAHLDSEENLVNIQCGAVTTR